jgi:menaquinone-dependent protoporphyrinogen IX oxidase
MTENNQQKGRAKNGLKKALIAYSSRAGCTEEVALRIKEQLEDSSIATEIVKVNDKKQFKELYERDISEFSSILLGTSIIAGKFHKNINKILGKLDSANIDDKKLGFFICCMKACDTKKVGEAINEYIEPNINAYNLTFSIIDAFGGRLDFSPNSTMNFMVKKLLKKIMLKDNPDLEDVEPKVYDFRDWDKINKFASSWVKINSSA